MEDKSTEKKKQNEVNKAKSTTEKSHHENQYSCLRVSQPKRPYDKSDTSHQATS